ncbi:MAG: HDOD domain-containing protein [Candidatus Krumholzibacteriota bacterium]|nr:HDOD domain-containing protein [Candidatus Krumholzibacteriota bacterium]
MAQDVSLEKLIMLTGDLPPMPYVARRVMEVVNKPSTNAQILQEIISKDQGLSGQILKIANSALYACSRRIETLTDAIIMLGFNAIRSLSIMSATKNLYEFTRRGKVLGLKDKLMWEHSVAAAIGARMIAQRVDVAYTEQAFMGGLLHDIGKLVILQKLPDAFDQIVEEVYNTGRYFDQVELEKLHFTHAEVGALLMKKWKLPEDFEEAIRHHHSVSPEINLDSQLVYYIDLANLLCRKLGLGFINEPEIDISSSLSAITLGISPAELQDLEQSIKTILNQEVHVFM